jgi:hypothetical protein
MSLSREDVEPVMQQFSHQYFDHTIRSCGISKVGLQEPQAVDKDDHCIVVGLVSELSEGSLPSKYKGVRVFAHVQAQPVPY